MAFSLNSCLEVGGASQLVDECVQYLRGRPHSITAFSLIQPNLMTGICQPIQDRELTQQFLSDQNSSDLGTHFRISGYRLDAMQLGFASLKSSWNERRG